MNNPKPVQSPLPICIGGRGKTRTLPTTARYAHHWNFGGTETDEWTGVPRGPACRVRRHRTRSVRDHVQRDLALG